MIKHTIIKQKDVLDKFYTNPDIANLCFDFFKKHKLPIDLYIEPSAGNGSFFNILPENKKGYDIDPLCDNVIVMDFFKTYDDDFDGNICYIGNPPFGKNSSLAISFFRKCASNIKTLSIAFILPLCFRKTSIQKRLSKNFSLLDEMILPNNAFLLNNIPYHVPSCFQIWIRKNQDKKNNITNRWFSVITKDVAFDIKNNTPDAPVIAIRRVGSNCGKILDGLDYKPSSTYFIYVLCDNFFELYKKLDFNNIIVNTTGAKSLALNEIIEKLSNIQNNNVIPLF